MDGFDHQFDSASDICGSQPTAVDGPGGWTAPESHLEFLSRRALEESRLAGAARSAAAAAAHRYLAAAYARQIAKEVATAAALEELLLEIE